MSDKIIPGNPNAGADTNTPEKEAPASERPRVDVVALTAQVAGISDNIDAMVKAALAQNASAAPPDELTQRIQSIENTLAQFAPLFDTVANLVGVAVPGAAPVLERIGAIEAALAHVAPLAVDAAMGVAHIVAHFQGKVSAVTSTPLQISRASAVVSVVTDNALASGGKFLLPPFPVAGSGAAG